MSHHDVTESAYTEQEQEDNSRADTAALFAIVVILVGMLVFFAAS